VVTPVNVHDKHALLQLLHGPEKRMDGDNVYRGQKTVIRAKAQQVKDLTHEWVRCRKDEPTDDIRRAKNRAKSNVWAQVEHVFAVVKRPWGFTKVGDRGLVKNASRAFTPLALANLYLARDRLPGEVRSYWAACGAKGP
jgi:IS5 family transposase